MKNRNNPLALLNVYTRLLVILAACLLPVNYCAAEPETASGTEIQDIRTPVTETGLPEASPELQPQLEEAPPLADSLLPGDIPPQQELPPADQPADEPAPVETTVPVDSAPLPSAEPPPADLPPPADIPVTQEMNPDNPPPQLPDEEPATVPRQEP